MCMNCVGFGEGKVMKNDRFSFFYNWLESFTPVFKTTPKPIQRTIFGHLLPTPQPRRVISVRTHFARERNFLSELTGTIPWAQGANRVRTQNISSITEFKEKSVSKETHRKKAEESFQKFFGLLRLENTRIFTESGLDSKGHRLLLSSRFFLLFLWNQ